MEYAGWVVFRGRRLSWWADDLRIEWFLVDAAILGALPVVGIVVFLIRRRRHRQSQVWS
jgi:hypothetical protein